MLSNSVCNQTRDETNWTHHSYDNRLSWTPLNPTIIMNNQLFVVERYLFLAAQSFPQPSLPENRSFLGTDIVRGQISVFKAGSHVERKREQNEIRTHISVSQDGSNLVPRVRVTLDQQSGNVDSGNEIKDGGGGRHLGFSERKP